MDKKTVSFVIPHLGKGGAERVVSIISNYLATSNFKVEIILFPKAIIDYEVHPNIKIRQLGSKRQEKTKTPKKAKVKKLTLKQKFVRFFRAVKKNTIVKVYRRFFQKPWLWYKKMLFIRKHTKHSDITVSFLWEVNIISIIASLFRRNKLIISDRNDINSQLEAKYRGKTKRALVTFCLKNLYKLATMVVFQTNDAKSFYPTSVQNKSVVIPNPLTKNLPARCTTERKKEVVAVCRLAPQKNIEMMIDAFSLFLAEHPDFTFIIYGEGRLRGDVEAYIKKLALQDKILLPGFCKDVHSKIVSSAIYLSASDFEGISNSMLEALGMGIPSVVTDCPAYGARMFIENNVSGILIPVRDTQAMVAGMTKIVSDKGFCEMLSENAVKINAEISEDKICAKWVDLIYEVIK